MSIDETIAVAVTAAVINELEPLLQKTENRVLSEQAVLEMLDVSAQTLRRMRADGLKSYRPYGTKCFYFEKDLEQYIKHKGKAV